jgi:hypothetical protein
VSSNNIIPSSKSELTLHSCPICQVIPKRTRGGGNSCYAIVSPWIRELGVTRKRLSRYSICAVCKVGWFSLRYSEEGLQNLYMHYRGENYTAIRTKWEGWYSQLYNYGHESESWLRLRSDTIKNFLRDKINLSSLEVVDIGGDTGEIAAKLGAKTFRVEEISDRAEKSNNADDNGERVMAMLGHVLEHVRFPKEFLKTLLGDYESVYVEVPNGLPKITKRRRSIGYLLIGLAASLHPFFWRTFSHPSAGRSNPADLLRVSEHLTFFTEESLEALSADLFDAGISRSFRVTQILPPQGSSPVLVLQAFWSR